MKKTVQKENKILQSKTNPLTTTQTSHKNAFVKLTFICKYGQ